RCVRLRAGRDTRGRWRACCQGWLRPRRDRAVHHRWRGRAKHRYPRGDRARSSGGCATASGPSRRASRRTAWRLRDVRVAHGDATRRRLPGADRRPADDRHGGGCHGPRARGDVRGDGTSGVHGMSDPRWHLAQLNVGRLLAPVESPVIEGFRAQLEPVNALADAHPGFVWRLQTEAGNATDIRPTEDDLFLINMSVWESIEALRGFTYTTAHVQVLRHRRSWFEQLTFAHLVLWWVSAGTIPTVDEAMD